MNTSTPRPGPDTQPSDAKRTARGRQERLADHLGASRPRPPPPTWRGVFFDGPQPDQDEDGEEIPVWLVYVGNENAEPIGTVYQCHSFELAASLAGRMAKDRRLELIQEATTA